MTLLPKLARWAPLSALLLALSISASAAPQGVEAPPATLAEAERELAELDRRAVDLDTRTGHLVAELAMRERRAVARARVYARLARAGLLPVAGGFDAFVSHAMKIEGARRAIVNDLSSLTTMRDAHSELVSQREHVAARRAVVVAQRDALTQAQQLIDEAEERKRSFDRAFASSNTRSEHIAIYGAGVTVREDGAAAESFESLRGRLPFPLTGRAEVKAARRQSANGPGLELSAPQGTAVRAVAAGRVAFSARYGDYGRIVIVDHGDKYFSVSANLGTVEVRVGDEVTAGARIGTVGDEGAGSMLYFELRHGNETLDSRAWLGV